MQLFRDTEGAFEGAYMFGVVDIIRFSAWNVGEPDADSVFRASG